MKYAQIIFSPTGGTKAAAEAVTARWDGPVETVDLCTPPGAPAEASFAPEDLALIAMPSYGGRVPALAAEGGYSDVPEDHWAAESVRQATELGLFEGVGGGFEADAHATYIVDLACAIAENTRERFLLIYIPRRISHNG